MSGFVVADASLAFKWIVDEEYAQEARSLLSHWRHTDTLAIAPSLFFYEIANENLHLRAIELTYRFGIPATYDAHYLALAEREDCELWTADERLWNVVRSEVDWVRWIGAQPPQLP